MKNLRLLFILCATFFIPLLLLAQPVKSELKEFLTPVQPDLIITQLENSEYFLSKTVSEERYLGIWEAIDSTEYFYDEEERLIEKKWWNYYWYPEINREIYKYSSRFPDSVYRINEQGFFEDWIDIKKTWHFFDDNRHRTKTDITYYDDGRITNLDLYRYQYNESGQLIADTLFYIGLGYESTELNTYEYDESGNLIKETNSSFVFYDTTFERSIYEYDVHNNLIRRLDQSADSIDAVIWKLDYTTSWEYDDQNRLITYLEFSKNWEDPAYIDSIRMTYEYPSPYLTVIISQDLSTFKSFKDLRLQTRNNENGQNTSNLLEVWQDSTWRGVIADTSTYNQDGLIELYLLQGKPETEWMDFERTKYFYGQFTGLSESIISNLTFTTFPNPSQGQITISWPNTEVHEGLILLFDLYGRQVFSQKAGLTEQIYLQLPDLPNGTYLIKVTDGKNWGGQRIQILK